MELLIWEARTEKNITLDKLSELTGISRSALSNYENGIRYPNMEQMERISKSLGIRIQKLYISKYK